jgi:hypothetical protein
LSLLGPNILLLLLLSTVFSNTSHNMTAKYLIAMFGAAFPWPGGDC